jgi:hypothetical protein
VHRKIVLGYIAPLAAIMMLIVDRGDGQTCVWLTEVRLSVHYDRNGGDPHGWSVQQAVQEGTGQ